MTIEEAKKYFKDNHYEFDSEATEESYCKLAAEFAQSKLEQAEKEKRELAELLNEAAHFLNHQGDLSAMPTDKWSYKEWMILRFQLNEKLKQIEL